MALALIPFASGLTITVPTTTHLGSVQGSYVFFSVSQPLSFLHIVKDADPAWKDWVLLDSGLGLYVDGVNITVTRYFAGDILEFTSTGPLAASAKIYSYADTSPIYVSSVSGWSYDPATHVTSLALANPNASVIVDWNTATTGGGGGGGVPEPTPTGDLFDPFGSPLPTATPLEFGASPSPNLPESSEGSVSSGSGFYIAILVLVVLVVAVGIVEHESKPSLRRVRKKLRKQRDSYVVRPKMKKKDSLLGD